MRVPRATYRLQLNEGFTFRDATEIVQYLAELGVSDLYTSPYTRARPGSTHGYDVVDHNSLNPEIGPAEDHKRLIEALHSYNMGHLLDIVPNHMGISSDNEWWMSMLENGPASPYASFFDVDWSPINRGWLSGKVLLPILGDHYRTILEGGELKPNFDAESGSLSIFYYEHRLPLDPSTYPMVLDELPERTEETFIELQSIVAAFENLPGRDEPDADKVSVRNRDSEVHKERLARLCNESGEVADVVAERVGAVSENIEKLHRILEEQAYRLVYWRVSSDEINYRRFFSINDLAGIRVEDERVFEATHRLVAELLRDGRVDGLRIDHPDGLYDPAGYFHRLQRMAAESLDSAEEHPIYVVAEKILASHEDLPEDWPVAGTTGYDFTNLVNGLFVDSSGEEGVDRAYRRYLGSAAAFEEVLYESKKLIMRDELASELNVLARRLLLISEGYDDRRSFDFTINVLRDALSEVVAAFPVYRTYITAEGVADQDRRYIERAISGARENSAAADESVFDFIHRVLLLEIDGPEGYRDEVRAFVMKFQQYTGPVMAKGMEDTALYRYNRLVSLNEVGGEPERFGVSVSAFHDLSAQRAKRWPHAMLASSTHDTKRGEDVRARINVLSEIPVEWRRQLVGWARSNRSLRSEINGEPAPSRNDEYLLYQTLLGAWPLEEMDEESLKDFLERIQAYMQKAMREAQVHTSWTGVNEQYEEAVARFVEALLSPGHDPFVEKFAPFQRRVARLGALNSLSQTLVKLTSPGVPDIYQGNELWDLSLVDPDNRRPVDYELRRRLLSVLKRMEPAEARSLLEEGAWQNGGPKLYLTWRALELRRDNPELFEEGEYVPLETVGERPDRIAAFARRSGDGIAITVAPRLCSSLAANSGLRFRDDAWSDTRIALPNDFHAAAFRNVFTGEPLATEEHDGAPCLTVSTLLRSFPVSLLRSLRANDQELVAI